MARLFTVRSLSLIAIACGLVLGGAIVSLTSTPALAQDGMSEAKSGSFEIDPGHTSVNFRIKHLNVAYFLGRFNKASGTMMIDPDNPRESFIDITIDAASVDTNSEGRDNHVKSGDFLSVKQFPTATFKTTAVRNVEGKLKATGDFTLHGITKEITVDLDFTGQGNDPWGGERQGVETKFTFKRSDYGISAMLGGLSDEVNMHVAIEAKR